MRDAEGERSHFKVLETNNRSGPQKAEHEGDADEIEHAEDAHLRMLVSNKPRATSATVRFAR
jgi:hypothetical protein